MLLGGHRTEEASLSSRLIRFLNRSCHNISNIKSTPLLSDKYISPLN